MKNFGTLIAGAAVMILIGCGGTSTTAKPETQDQNTTVNSLSVASLKILSGGYTFTLQDNTHVFAVESAYLKDNAMVSTTEHCKGIPEIDPENNGKDILSDKANHFSLLDYPSSGYAVAMNCVINHLDFDLHAGGYEHYDRNFGYIVYHDSGDIYLTHVNDEYNDQTGLEILVLPGDLTATAITRNGVTYSNITITDERGQKIVEFDSDAESIGGHYRIVFEEPYGIVEMTHTK